MDARKENNGFNYIETDIAYCRVKELTSKACKMNLEFIALEDLKDLREFIFFCEKQLNKRKAKQAQKMQSKINFDSFDFEKK